MFMYACPIPNGISHISWFSSPIRKCSFDSCHSVKSNTRPKMDKKETKRASPNYKSKPHTEKFDNPSPIRRIVLPFSICFSNRSDPSYCDFSLVLYSNKGFICMFSSLSCVIWCFRISYFLKTHAHSQKCFSLLSATLNVVQKSSEEITAFPR